MVIIIRHKLYGFGKRTDDLLQPVFRNKFLTQCCSCRFIVIYLKFLKEEITQYFNRAFLSGFRPDIFCRPPFSFENSFIHKYRFRLLHITPYLYQLVSFRCVIDTYLLKKDKVYQCYNSSSHNIETKRLSIVNCKEQPKYNDQNSRYVNNRFFHFIHLLY